MTNSKYAAVVTKVRAMRARRVTDEDFKELIKSQKLSEIFNYLKDRTYYGDFLKNLNPENLHRAEIEARLSDLKIKEIEKLMYYLSGDDKRFLETFLIRLEIEALRILIRGLSRQEDLNHFRSLMVYSKKFSKVPFEELMAVKDWESFKKALIDTDYFRVLEIYKEIEDRDELVIVEKNLDRYYYDLTRRRLLELNQKENKELVTAYRRNIDLLNIISIYRSKKFYSLSREELIVYSLRGGYEFPEKKLFPLIEAKDTNEMKEVLKDSSYYFLLDHTKTIDLYMERRRQRFMYYHYLKLFTEKNKGIAAIIAYIRLLDYEVEDITAVIESKRYRMNPEETEKYLIRSFE